jgi:hypothetical protein
MSEGLLYIAGTSYSGSTLLAFLLNAHPEIVSVGEPTGPIASTPDPDAYPCSCGLALPQCPFWQDVAARMHGRGLRFAPRFWRTDFDLYESRIVRQLVVRSLRANALDRVRDTLAWSVPPVRRRFDEAGRRIEAFVDSVREASGKRVFADASKDAIRAHLLGRFTRFAPRVVHLVRDAPAFVASNMQNTKQDLDWSVRTWLRNAGHVERLFQQLPPEQQLRVRYEDLCREPAKTLDRIAAFANVAPFAGPVDFRAVPHHVIGNRMRLGSSSEIRLDESWRERLTPAQIDAVMRRTAAWRARLGYA